MHGAVRVVEAALYIIVIPLVSPFCDALTAACTLGLKAHS